MREYRMDKISFRIDNWGRYAIFQILKMDEQFRGNPDKEVQYEKN